jgi:iron complex transport system ATP-binding protein
MIGGRNLNSLSARGLAKIRAFLEQDSSIAFDSRVIDAVLLGRYVYGNFAAGSEDLAYAKNSLKEVGLEDFEDRFFMSLSGGEKRRVMLARVLAQLARQGSYEDTLLILDEPSSGLDPAHAHGALKAARKLADKGAAVLTVLHDPNLAVQYAQKIAFLKSGRLLGVYSAKEAMNAELLENTYNAKCKIISDGLSDYALFLK